MAGQHRIVVGIDFGTTYSAVAWAESSHPSQIEIIKNWPTSGQLVGAQTPTEVAYVDGDTTNYSWGYNISPRARKVSGLLLLRKEC
jgi:molecular chaperone DnaK (HSP70)